MGERLRIIGDSPVPPARRWAEYESMRPVGDRADLPAPLTLPWFDYLHRKRYRRSGAWLSRLLEFDRHAGDRVVCWGRGVGLDWAEFARRGADVTGCCDTAEQLDAVREHFRLRGLAGRAVMQKDQLPLADASADVVVLSKPAAFDADPDRWAAEATRVLKPGGKLLALLPARNDIDRWGRLWPRHHNRPAYTAASLRRHFVDLRDLAVRKRQLRGSEVPPAWRWLPLPVLQRLFGRVLVVRAFKPVAAARRLSAAA